MSSFAIIGGGESLRGVDLAPLRSNDVTIIALNGIADHFDFEGYWFTLDPAGINIERLRRLPASVKPIMAVPRTFDRPSFPDVTFYDRIEGSECGRFRARYGLSRDPRGVHTGTSAYGGLGVAVHMGARRVALLGIDGYGGGHWYDADETAGPMGHFPDLFASAVPDLSDLGVSVLNGSAESTITCFPRTGPSEAIEWLLSSPAS